MVADRFSMTDDIKCFSCNELVNFGDDYEAHLQVVHNVTKNFSFYMSKALEQKKFQKNPVEIEVVEMSDSEPEDIVEDKESTEEFSSKLNMGELSMAAEQAIVKRLGNIVSMCEGSFDLKDEEVKLEDGKDYEKELWEAFESLKTASKDVKLSKQSRKNIFGKLKSNLKEPIRKAVVVEKGSGNTTKGSKAFNNGLVGKAMKSGLFKSPTDMPSSSESLGPIGSPSPSPSPIHNSPAKSTSSKGSKSGQSHYLCPKAGCHFTSTNKDMKTGAGARHLSQDHQVTAQILAAQKGKWTFKKSKAL